MRPILRRASSEATPVLRRDLTFEGGALVIDVDRHEVLRDGKDGAVGVLYGIRGGCMLRPDERSMGPNVAQTRPVTVQVIAYAPTVFRHCQHCEVAFAGLGLGERIQRAEAVDVLPDELIQEFQQVSDWVHSLLGRHRGRVRVSVVDAASIEGFWTSLRHRVRRYPAVVVDGRERLVGTDFGAADRIIDQRLAERIGPVPHGGKGAA